MRIILSNLSRRALKWSRLNHCLVVFDDESGSCRLAAGCSGLTSPPAPFRDGIAPADSFLKTESVSQNQFLSVAINSRIQAAYWPNSPPIAPIRAEIITP